MSLTDTIKTLHARATDRTCPARIVFHHVPKCGGTSVGRAIRRAYLLSQATVTPVASERAFDLARASRDALAGLDVSHLREMMLLYHLASDRRCIAAHVPFSDVAFDAFNDRYRFLTVLRDPIERFVSNVAWSRRKGAFFRIDEPLEAFLGTERARKLGATYARYFCGTPGGRREAWSVDRAIGNLRRMDGVGFLDDLAGFRDTLFEATGHRFRIGHENEAPPDPERAALLDGPLGRRIAALCAPDLEIWAAVQSLRRPGSRGTAILTSKGVAA